MSKLGENSEAIQAAQKVLKNAYAPYSKFYVGAALVGKNGKVYSGCNVENAIYQGVCAERVALGTAVADGCKDFVELYVTTDAKLASPPCGYCRQFLAEFFDPNTKIHIINKGKVAKTFSFSELLPHSFVAKNLEYES